MIIIIIILLANYYKEGGRVELELGQLCRFYSLLLPSTTQPLTSLSEGIRQWWHLFDNLAILLLLNVSTRVYQNYQLCRFDSLLLLSTTQPLTSLSKGIRQLWHLLLDNLAISLLVNVTTP